MSSHQPFNDFLSSPGPSTPRGGRGRGGRGSPFRGRGRVMGSSGGRSKFTSDYSHVAFDYDAINRQKYTKLDGFTVAPFGPTSTTNDPGPSPYSTPRGRRGTLRGQGRGAISQTHPRTPVSGSATPVTGLGYPGKGKGVDKRAYPDSRGGYKSGDTVGRTGVMCGGGAAPLFVKAGELFKDGEVDIISIDKDRIIHVDVEPLSDPSAPQMTNLEDEVEVEIVDSELLGLVDVPPIDQPPSRRQSMHSVHSLHSPGSEVLVSSPQHAHHGHQYLKEQIPQTSTTVRFERSIIPQSPVTVSKGSRTIIEGSRDVVEITHDTLDTSLFFVDTTPAAIEPVSPRPNYTSTSIPPLGSTKHSSSPDEKIIFQPRHYPKAQTLTVNVAPAALPSLEPLVRRAFVNPRALPRREKKALKKDKRGRTKGKGKVNKAKRGAQVYEGSDLDWGSDGPPVNILNVEGVGEDDAERDVAVLRDYLAGTLLGAAADKEDEDGNDVGGRGEGDSEEDLDALKQFGDGAAELGNNEEFQIDSGEEDNPSIGSSASGSGSEEVEDDDDGDSSDLGDLRFALQNVEGDDESEDVEELFNGKDDWNDTEWFIQNMEEAFDGDVDMGDRKSRNAIFRAVENGDFGEDWPTGPAKKNKQGSHIPSELQNQWEKDRQRKAERRKQRDLERLVDLIDPYHTANKKSKSKGKGKGTSRIEKARLAHLIPESATCVAEMFDIPTDDDDDDGPVLSHGRMGRMPDLLPGGRGLRGIDDGIRSFLEDEGKTTYSVPPMDKEGRKKIHMLAECYGLSSKSRGKGKARFTVLTKTLRAGLHIDEMKISRLLSAAPFTGGAFYKALHPRSMDGTKTKRGPVTDRRSSARLRDGETVGEGADKIGMENVGHRLLSKMGWAEGAWIGKSGGGLENPIVAIVKNTKMGLGA